MEGVDYSDARPRPWVLAQAGKRFAIRYVGPGRTSKLLTRAEANLLKGAGLAIACVAEGAARDALTGRATGSRHAGQAHQNVVAAGGPSGAVIFFALDWDASPAELERTVPYFDGAAAAIGFSRVGVYGGYRTIDWAIRRRVAVKFWQTYAWSGGRVHGGANLLQYHNGVSIDGGQVDLCRSISADFGQWHPPTETVGSAPASVPAPDEAQSWDYAPTIDATSRYFDYAAAMLEGSAHAIEAGY